ncbi:alanine racemase [Luminiphilus sp.]|nr:alanine racemase [Luminiphilus sp.]
MTRATALHIDLSVISANVSTLRQRIGAQKFMAVVKADAYGHGAVRVAQHIETDVDALAVAITEEAIALREAGVVAPILVLEGPQSEDELLLMADMALWPTLHHAEQLAWCGQHASLLSAAWLKVDTGMHRLGFSADALPQALSALQATGITDITLMSHLATAEYPEAELTRLQQGVWHEQLTDWPAAASLHNSAAARTQSEGRSDWARIGYALYGGQINGLTPDETLRPAMRFTTSVLTLRDVKSGESVGYGGRWIAQRDSRIATLPVGYADGYPWAAVDGTPIGIAHQTAPLAGQVSMDMMTVDVTDCAHIELGAPAELWGAHPTVDQAAQHCNTIGYELMTRVTSRVPRCYHA